MSNEMSSISFYLPRNLARDMRVAASKLNMSRSRFLTLVVRKAIVALNEYEREERVENAVGASNRVK